MDNNAQTIYIKVSFMKQVNNSIGYIDEQPSNYRKRERKEHAQ